MEKISRFMIRSIAITGFKCFQEPIVFDFGSMNRITGFNGTGKTTIADAIAFAITGVPFSGDVKAADRLYAGDTRSILVDMTIEDGEGRPHRLMRERTNDHMTITYDGTPLRKTDMEAMFGERDVFLSIWNPLYFIERLGDNGRDLLMRYLPVVSHEDVMDHLDPISREVLKDDETALSSPEGYMKRLRSDIRENESTITYLEGQRDMLAKQRKEREEKEASLQKELDEARDRADELERHRFEGIDQDTVADCLATLYAKRDDLDTEEAAADTQEADAAVESGIQAVEQCRSRQYEPKYTELLAKVEQECSQLVARKAKDQNVYAHLRPGIQCPTCHQAITEENIGHVRELFHRTSSAVDARVAELEGQRGEALELERKAREAFEQFKADDLAKAEAALAQARQRRQDIQELAAAAYTRQGQELKATLSQISYYETQRDYGVLTSDEVAELEQLQARISQLDAALADLRNTDDETAAERQDKIDQLRDINKDKTQKLNAAGFYAAKQRELLFGDFRLNRVGLSLYDVFKTTGETKEAFRFTYEGRPYQWLSQSEKIKAGLEVSQLIGRLTGRDYPVFIDNAESVAAIDNITPGVQTFLSQVVRQRQGVRVDIVGAGGGTAQAAPAGGSEESLPAA